MNSTEKMVLELHAAGTVSYTHLDQAGGTGV